MGTQLTLDEGKALLKPGTPGSYVLTEIIGRAGFNEFYKVEDVNSSIITISDGEQYIMVSVNDEVLCVCAGYIASYGYAFEVETKDLADPKLVSTFFELYDWYYGDNILKNLRTWDEFDALRSEDSQFADLFEKRNRYRGGPELENC